MSVPVLIYDGDCPYCSVAAVALKRIEGIVAVSWYADPVGPFLSAQFGAKPFAMVLVDPEESQVYAGRSAAKELTDRAGTPGIVGSLVRDNYEHIAGVVGLLSGRGRDPDDYHDTYELTPEAAAHVDALRSAGERDGTRAVADAAEGSDPKPGA
ncbi:MAG: DUF393 domain-containing protein [Halovenus sp.]